jgi:hypothetical protein
MDMIRGWAESWQDQGFLEKIYDWQSIGSTPEGLLKEDGHLA